MNLIFMLNLIVTSHVWKHALGLLRSSMGIRTRSFQSAQYGTSAAHGVSSPWVFECSCTLADFFDFDHLIIVKLVHQKSHELHIAAQLLSMHQ